MTAAGRTQLKEVYGGSSFASTDSPWLTFGLGHSEVIDRIRVHWPSGMTEEFRNVLAGRTVILVEGSGESAIAGDCNGDGKVTVDELTRGVAIALGDTSLGDWRALDVDGNGRIDVAELLRAAENTLS